jgi:hypothetical protein
LRKTALNLINSLYTNSEFAIADKPRGSTNCWLDCGFAKFCQAPDAFANLLRGKKKKSERKKGKERNGKKRDICK